MQPSTPGSTAPPQPPDRLREQQREGGEMAHDQRGGWRFRDRAEQAAHGAASAMPPLGRPGRDPYNVAAAPDKERRQFGGDAQRPSHGYAHTGTQGTWSDALGTAGAAPSDAVASAPARPAAEDLQRLADDGGPPAPAAAPARSPAPAAPR